MNTQAQRGGTEGSTGVGAETPVGAEEGRRERRQTADLGWEAEQAKMKKGEERMAVRAGMTHETLRRQGEWGAVIQYAAVGVPKRELPLQTLPGCRGTATHRTPSQTPSEWKSGTAGPTE